MQFKPSIWLHFFLLFTHTLISNVHCANRRSNIAGNFLFIDSKWNAYIANSLLESGIYRIIWMNCMQNTTKWFLIKIHWANAHRAHMYLIVRDKKCFIPILHSYINCRYSWNLTSFGKIHEIFQINHPQNLMLSRYSI